MSNLIAKKYKCFEDIKRVRDDGSEFWNARELAPVLEYSKWENFSKVINRVMLACKNSGRDVVECFPEVRKTSKIGAFRCGNNPQFYWGKKKSGAKIKSASSRQAQKVEKNKTSKYNGKCLTTHYQKYKEEL